MKKLLVGLFLIGSMSSYAEISLTCQAKQITNEENFQLDILKTNNDSLVFIKTNKIPDQLFVQTGRSFPSFVAETRYFKGVKSTHGFISASIKNTENVFLQLNQLTGEGILKLKTDYAQYNAIIDGCEAMSERRIDYYKSQD